MANLVEALKELEKDGELLQVQILEQCIVRAKQKEKPDKHQEITFVTEQDVLNDDSRLGIIVWVDKEKFYNGGE